MIKLVNRSFYEFSLYITMIRGYSSSMIAVLVNAGAVVIGSLIGLLLHKWLGESLKNVIYIGVGLSALFIGIHMALAGQKVMYLIFSLILGGITGELLSIEKRIFAAGNFIKTRILRNNNEDSFAAGFLDASVLFCVGAMAIVGSIEAGAYANYDTIFSKSIMDGFMSIILTASLGIGVMFSAVSILLYQGLITVLAQYIEPLASVTVQSEIKGIGGLLIIMIGLNLLKLTSIKTSNFLPSLLFVFLFLAIDPFITRAVFW